MSNLHIWHEEAAKDAGIGRAGEAQAAKETNEITNEILRREVRRLGSKKLRKRSVS